MAAVLLASLSLFALVGSRPVLPDVAHAVCVQGARPLQAPFCTHPGKSEHDPPRFQFLPPTPLPAPAVLLDDPLQHVFDTGDEHVEFQTELDTDGPPSQRLVATHHEAPTNESPSAPLVVLAFSCIAAFVALACIAVTLRIIKHLRSKMIAAKRAWELLPRFWRPPRSSVPRVNTAATAKKHLVDRGCLLLQPQACLLDTEEPSVEKHALLPEVKPLYFDALSDMDSEGEDADGNFQDALDLTPLPFTHDLPPDGNVPPHQSHLDDPLSPSLQSSPFVQPTGDHSTPVMHELCPSPVSRPAWSVRAIDSPPLGISSREAGVPSTSQTLIHPRRRAYRSAIPDFDIALAMQLRPGLGIGADSAWMVRFLMAMFGWFAVALTGTR